MKCPLCGAWSQVLDTRSSTKSIFIRRRRRCANDHIFPSVEVYPHIVDKREFKRQVKLITERTDRFLRDTRIRADTRTNSAIAAAHGLTEARVRQIKRLGASPRKSKEK